SRHDAELEHAVVGAGVFERLKSADELPHVAEQDAARLALVPLRPVHLNVGAKGLGAQVFRRCPNVRDPAEPPFKAAVSRVANHRGIKARTSHDGETLTVEAPEVEAAPRTVKPDGDCAFNLGGYAEVRRE